MTIEEFNQFVDLGSFVSAIEIGEDLKPRVKECQVIALDMIYKGRFDVRGERDIQSYENWYLTKEQAVKEEIRKHTEAYERELSIVKNLMEI